MKLISALTIVVNHFKPSCHYVDNNQSKRKHVHK